jgi:FKBP-type peptidyl-prolyl cis-trans isomerase FkpA
MKNNFPAYLLVFLFLSGCSHKTDKPITEQQFQETEKALVDVNRMLVKKDKQKITDYIQKHNLRLQESESGLWYGIVNKGNGPLVSENSQVMLNYKVSLLDGTKCYDSDSLGSKQFIVGKGGVEAGLDEGIRFLNEGSEAILIIPPHLAFGLQGDGDKIPARSVIIYHIKLLKVQS